MRSDAAVSVDADATFATELKAALRREGLRGAYAAKLQAEWLGHYANLRDSLTGREAIVRLGSPDALAASAARTRFEGHWWCAWPVVAGVLAGVAAFLLATALCLMPPMFLLDPAVAWTWSVTAAYAQVFNWLGALAGLIALGWATGRLSSPPRFRRALLLSFALLGLTLSMVFNPPSGGPGTGSFVFGSFVGANDYLLLAFRLAVFVAAFRWCRRAA
jgi:hypothetical protein